MKKKEWNEGLNHLDPDLVEKHIEQTERFRQQKQKSIAVWRRFGAIAACFVLIFGAVIVVPILREDDPGIIPGPGPGSEIILPSPPAYYSYVYESYDVIYDALTNPLSPKFIQLRLEQGNCGEVYQQTLSDFAFGEIKVAIPQINGENISLRNREGFSNVTWFTSELYKLPWIWYHCLINEQDLTVSIAYLSVLDRTELNSATSYYQVLKMISPNSPSPDNYKKSASYKNIYEKEITLGNGETVTAMISELKNDSRIYVCLYLDGMLVILRGDEALLTEELFQTFNIAYMK